MNQFKWTILGSIVFAIIVTLYSSLFIVMEGQLAIITRFGRPVGNPKMKAGLHFKLPFIEDAKYLEKRILTWDGSPNQIPTKGKKYIVVDTTARWKIIDPLKFIASVNNVGAAQARLKDTIDAKTRDAISNNFLVEAVRNSNSILEVVKEKKVKEEKSSKDIEDLEIVGEIEPITTGREKISEVIAQKADVELRKIGIKLIDVQLRRIAYGLTVEEKVFDRMISERQRIAEKIRSVGKGEKAKIEGRLSQDLQRIESQAYKTAEVIKGVAESKAIKIYADAFSQNPEFYKFLKSMEIYEKSFSPTTEMILSTKHKFLELFYNNYKK